MWYIFPQIRGLGPSPTAEYYAIRDQAETQAYLSHPLLGKRLHECISNLLQLTVNSADDIFPYPDNLKFCSSMTLFEYCATDKTDYKRAIDALCNGHRDEKTLALVQLKHKTYLQQRMHHHDY